MNYSIKRDIIQDSKYVFLRFLQGFFSNEIKYNWTADIRTTNIIIVDKNTIDLGVSLTRPAIILNRNGSSWSYITGNQNAVNTVPNLIEPLGGNLSTARSSKDTIYSDLLTGSMSFTVLSKNGITSERIASTIFILLTGHKSELRSAGIHKVTNLTVGPEQILKQSSENELISVTVGFSYFMQGTVSKMPGTSDATLLIGTELLIEGFDYNITLGGGSVYFLRKAPVIIPRLNYIDAVTLEERSDVELVPTGDPRIFALPGSDRILGYYKVLDSIESSISVEEN